MTSTSLAPRTDRAAWTVLVLLLIACVAVGLWPVAGVAATHLPALAVPAAIGLPYLWPPLRLVGNTTWTLWAIDLAGAVVMLLAAWGMLRHAAARHPRAHPGRTFGRAVWVTMLAVVAGNIVRGVGLSFVTHADIGTYVGTLVAGIVVSALTGVLLGLVIGAIAALVALLPRRVAADPAAA